MPLQLARHSSNRAKARSTLERKRVFRSVLENPFQISWPSVPLNAQNVILARLVASLENLPPRVHASRKISLKSASPDHQRNIAIAEEVAHINIHTTSSRASGQACVDSPSDASHLVIGINEVTRALELQLRLTRQRTIVDNLPPNSDQAPPCSPPSPIGIVFACSADVDPTALIDHIPYLVAGCNSPRNVTQPIKLVPLPKGSEPAISQILGVRRAAVIAFRRGSPLFETVEDILGSIPTLSAPWLCSLDTQGTSQLVPTHIKQLCTSAPKDMRGAREQRAKARAAAKKNAPSSSRSVHRKPRVTLTTGTESAARNGNDHSNC